MNMARNTQIRLIRLDKLTHTGAANMVAGIDTINSRWRRNTLQYASSGISKPWRMAQDRKSPAYTTSWHELPKVKASL